MSCLNLTGKPQTTTQAAEAKRMATEEARMRAERFAADEQPKRPEPGEDALDAKLSALGRCRCGLLLPCDDCVPDIYEYAGMRKPA